ncbi:MAG: LPS export ABC transporter periplasmic protein LptC [Saprospiraceae bacterium]|nr:LPS export ABC transporter periplasmic protein LptC [Saprospiraceae bacterium]
MLFLAACENDVAEVNAITSKEFDTKVDVGKEVIITYSDSGKVQVVCESPEMQRLNTTDTKDIFPKGLKITFLDDNLMARAWLEADYAERLPFKYIMIARGNVKLYNTQNEKLQTSELIWDETKKLIYTEKFVRITRPTQRDTTYSLGFETDQNFKQIILKRRIQSKLNADNISNSLGL